MNDTLKDVDALCDEDLEYLYGSCHEWAFLNYTLGDSFFVVTDYDFDIEKYALIHCGLLRNGMYTDVRGSAKELDEILNDFESGDDIHVEILTIDEFLEFCNDYNLPLLNLLAKQSGEKRKKSQLFV